MDLELSALSTLTGPYCLGEKLTRGLHSFRAGIVDGSENLTLRVHYNLFALANIKKIPCHR
ncbi:hypothetical protein BH10PSE7_BH10PSE7_28220 [soil metagenome]